MNKEGLILFSDKRQREHHRRQSVTVDDTDLLLHKRANRRSILYGGNSQGPKFWSQLSAAWSGNNTGNVSGHLPATSPTSVRDVQPEWTAQQEKAILKASGNLAMPSTTNSNIEDDDLIKVTYLDDGASHHRTSATSISTISTTHSTAGASGGMDVSSSSHQSQLSFRSIWDRLDALSIHEHRYVEAYHQTVSEQNEKIHGTNKTTTATTAAPAMAVPQEATTMGHLRGRLRKQHSWNGRESQRNVQTARGSILAEVDDCSLRQLLRVVEQEDQGHGSSDDATETTNIMLPGVDPNSLMRGGNHNAVAQDPARCRAEECVLNLVV